MGTITYFAVDRGNLVSGHSEGTEYTIEVDFELHDPITSRQINEVKSLSGNTFTRLHRKDEFDQLTTIWVPDLVTQNQMREFADSMDAGEEATIDPYGTVLNPLEPMTVTLKGDIKKNRYQKFEWWKYSFAVNRV